MLVGAHVSIAGGLDKAIERGERLGCRVIQIFLKNQMRWNAPTLSDEEASVFKSRLNSSDIVTVVAHGSYLINLATPESDKLNKSLSAFQNELIRCQQLGISYFVFHPGSHLCSGETTAIERVSNCINVSINLTSDSQVMLLLENTAGQGSNIGYSFDHLAEIIHRIENKSRIGICFDTAHAFAAGYDLRDSEVYRKTFQSLDRIVGLEKLKVIHLNDSKKGLNSRVDRHAKIGEGFIGADAFKLLMNDERFYLVPKVIEIPGNEIDYQNNLDYLKSMVN